MRWVYGWLWAVLCVVAAATPVGAQTPFPAAAPAAVRVHLAAPVGAPLPRGVPDPCPVSVDTEVAFDVGIPAPSLRRTRSISTLTAVKVHGTSRTLGLFSDRFEYGARIEGQIQTVMGGPSIACIWPKGLWMKWQKMERVIDVAAEVLPGSCLDGEILAHERRHELVSKSSTVRWFPTARSAFLAAVSTIAPVRFVPGQGIESKAVMAVMAKRASAAIEAVVARRNAEEELGQKLIDSPEEYQRVSRVCNFAAQRLIR